MEKTRFQKEEKIILGSQIRITDPCYGLDVWCAHTLDDVLPGKYVCYFDESDEGAWGKRIAGIEVRHEDHLYVNVSEYIEEAGVDSGQCGIFDYDYYVTMIHGDKKEEWYSNVCNQTYIEIPNPRYKSFLDSDTLALEAGKENAKLIKKILENGITSGERLLEEQLKIYKSAMERYEKSEEFCRSKGKFTAAITDERGFVSSSGYGDGVYPVYVGRDNNGKVVAIKILFIFDDEE